MTPWAKVLPPSPPQSDIVATPSLEPRQGAPHTPLDHALSAARAKLSALAVLASEAAIFPEVLREAQREILDQLLTSIESGDSDE